MKPIIKVVVFVLLPIISVFASTEAYLQYKYRDYNTDSTIAYNYTHLHDFDPFLQFKLSKGGYYTHVNSYGFRADEITKQKPEGTYRIFVLGGSTVMGANTDYTGTPVYFLDQYLHQHVPDKNIQVINAGVNGYTSEHSLIEYLFKIKDFDPDMIIMWHGVNDLMSSCSPGGVAYGPFQPDYSHYFYADANMVFSHFKPKPFFSINSLTYQLMSEAFMHNFYSDINDLQKPKFSYTGYYNRVGSLDQVDMQNFPSISSYKRNLESLIKVAKEDKVSLVLGDQPSLYGDSMTKDIKDYLAYARRVCTPDGKYLSIRSMIKGMRDVNTVTQKVANENEIPFVDLDASVPKTHQYFFDDVHGTVKGYKVVGETMGKYLILNRLLH